MGKSETQFSAGQYRLLTALGYQVDILSVAQVWTLLVLSIAVIVLLDFQLYPFQVFCGPLYLLPMCLASWRLGVKVGFATALLAAVLPFVVGATYQNQAPLIIGMANLSLHAAALGFLVAIVSSFRYAHDRQAMSAKSDSMTGALNKKAFAEKAEMLLAEARSNYRPLLLLFMDIDGFKTVNDQNGHGAGDAILRSFAAEASSSMRRSDCFGRIGGDEFAAVLSLEAPHEAHDVASAFHRRFSRVLAEGPHPVTCSMGALIVLPQYDAVFATLLREADQLMYDVKHNGKNAFRIATFHPDPVSSRSTALDASSALVA